MSKFKAVFDPQQNVVVRASAGTGKTFLLTARILNLLIANHKPDSILAITFTRKAAGEMQERIQAQLRRMAAASPQELAHILTEIGCEQEPQSMQRARQLYEDMLRRPQSLRIETFHSFCQNLLKRFPLEAGVTPGFEVVENNSEQLNQAWDGLILQAATDPDSVLGCALTELFTACGGLPQTRNVLFEFVEHRSDWWAYALSQPDPKSAQRCALIERLQLDMEREPLPYFFQMHRDSLRTYCEWLRLHPTKHNEKACHLIENAMKGEDVQDVLMSSKPKARGESDPDKCLTLLWQAFFNKKGEPHRMRATKVLENTLGSARLDQLLQLHIALTEAVQALHTASSRRALLQLNQTWLAAGEKLLDLYQNIKQEQRVLDFADLEWKAYLMLHRSDNALWIQYKMDQRIKHILVDEFQDTNPTQWHMLLPLLQEMAAQDEPGRSLFLVGDTKQSIYSFRRAAPALFRHAADWLQQHLTVTELDSHKSWRSAQGVLTFVNTVFAGQEDFPTHHAVRGKLWGSVEIHPLCQGEPAQETVLLRNSLLQPRAQSSETAALAEGRLIAQRVHALIAGQTPVAADAEGKQRRAAHYGDVMILVRKRTHVYAYEQALLEAGIPFLSADRGRLLETLEVGDLMALLQYLNAPMHDLALARVLRSPLFSCTDSDLMLMASTDGDTWTQRLAALAQQTSYPHFARARRLLDTWQTLIGQLPVHDLLDRIYAQADVVDRYTQCYPEHLRHRVRANLTRFLELALEVDSGRYPSVGRFLARLRVHLSPDDQGVDEAKNIVAEQRVRVLTIHGAKGLEAPIVILADTNNKEKRHFSHRVVVDWPAEQPQPRLFMLQRNDHDPLLKKSGAEQLRQEAKEEMNLLYVALTRAKQHLIITGQRSRLRLQTSWYDFICQQIDWDPAAADAPWSNEQGQAAATVAEPKPRQEQLRFFDAALTKPVTMPAAHVEIAPSAAMTDQPPPAIESAQHRGKEDAWQRRRRGRMIHRCLQRLSEGVMPEACRRELAAEFHLQPEARVLQQCLDHAGVLMRAPHLQPYFDPACYTQAFNELPVLYRKNHTVVHGVVDRLVLFQDRVVLLDYKSTTSADPAELRTIAESYRAQMRLYADGIELLWPDKPLTTLVVFTQSGHALAV